MIDQNKMNEIERGVKKIMGHKYGDFFLLGSVMLAFGALLILSVIG